MITDIRQHEHISIFTQNPLLLTAMCILYNDGKRIPDQRAELYNRVIDNLIHRRSRQRRTYTGGSTRGRFYQGIKEGKRGAAGAPDLPG
jgi:predicted NACHT family NTPase